MPRVAPPSKNSKNKKQRWTLGPALREAREAAGLSQREAAKTSGVSTTTWAHLENGERTVTAGYTIPMNPRASIVIAAAKTVGLDVEQALRMTGYDPREHLTKDDYKARPTVSQVRMWQVFSRLTPEQREAMLDFVETLVPADEEGDTDAS